MITVRLILTGCARRMGSADALHGTSPRSSRLTTRNPGKIRCSFLGWDKRSNAARTGYNTAMKLLVVEDDPGLAKLLRKALTEAGYSVQVSGDGAEAYRILSVEAFDLLLFDVMLPGMDGFALCRKAREAKITAPILMLTARDAVGDKVEGLDAGADDYVVKPFQIAELLARARALLRRGAAGASSVLTVGGLTLDPATREGNAATA